MTMKKIASMAFGAALAATVPLIEKFEDVKYDVYYDIAGIPTCAQASQDQTLSLVSGTRNASVTHC